MNEISQFFARFLNQLVNLNFGLLIIVDLAAFGAVLVFTLLFCALSPSLRRRDKRPLLHLINLFAALTFVIFASAFPLVQSVAAAALLWCVGYIFYGAVCALFKAKRQKSEGEEIAPVSTVRAGERAVRPVQSVPAVQTSVRLEHALSISDKLLLKTLGRSDRQELEKIKTALTVYKVKGTLSPQEGETLNDMFNALLKLMAKYDL